MRYEPRDYQRAAEEHMLRLPASGLFLDMGLGKTAATLSSIVKLIDGLEVRAVAIVAPLRVCRLVWPDEGEKWDQFRHLRFSLVRGSPVPRTITVKGVSKTLAANQGAIDALNAEADIYLITYDSIPGVAEWMRKQKRLPFDMIVWDESSKMKSPSARRFKLIKPVLPRFSRSVILTGTPSPQSYEDLWSQVYLLDRGQRLGAFVTHFRDRYFDFNRYSYEVKLKPGADRQIEEKIKDLVLVMESSDHLDLPPFVESQAPVELPTKAMEQYKELEREMVLALKHGTVEAVNAASLSGKCRQITAGALYHEAEEGKPRRWEAIHDAKLDALADLLEDAQGSSVLVCYEFKHELARLVERWPKAAVIGREDDEVLVRKWNARKVPLLFAHPASIGHGLNMQTGGNLLIWTSLTWALELYQQTVKRLHRPGQIRAVSSIAITARGTVDEVVWETIKMKAKGQASLLKALKAHLHI